MSAAVAIVNLALVRLRQKQLLPALDDTSTVGRSASLIYDSKRDLLLESYPWGFATGVEELSLAAGTAPPGWAYAYALPNECLYVRAVCDENGARYYARNLNAAYPELWTASGPYAVPFQIMRVAGEPRIVTDMPLAYAICTFQVENSEQFTPSFTDALAWNIAADLGPALNADDGVIETAQKWAIASLAIAKAQAGNQRQQDRPPESPTVSCRD